MGLPWSVRLYRSSRHLSPKNTINSPRGTPTLNQSAWHHLYVAGQLETVRNLSKLVRIYLIIHFLSKSTDNHTILCIALVMKIVFFLINFHNGLFAGNLLNLFYALANQWYKYCALTFWKFMRYVQLFFICIARCSVIVPCLVVLLECTLSNF